MIRTFVLAMLLAMLLAPVLAFAQATAATPRSDGAAIVMTGSAEIEVPNDEAVASFYLEVQDGDLAKAQSLLNQRVAEGLAQLKRSDPKGQVETAGYGSYPVYSREGRQVIAWRVRQAVTLRTSDLAGLPRTVAAAQRMLALGGVDFRLSRPARERVEAELIQAAVANLNARLAAAARALGVAPERLRTEELNFAVATARPPMQVRAMEMRASAAEPVVEPQLDAGRSLQLMTVTGRARLLSP
jgi:predicted secreted protein